MDTSRSRHIIVARSYTHKVNMTWIWGRRRQRTKAIWQLSLAPSLCPSRFLRFISHSWQLELWSRYTGVSSPTFLLCHYTTSAPCPVWWKTQTPELFSFPVWICAWVDLRQEPCSSIYQQKPSMINQESLLNRFLTLEVLWIRLFTSQIMAVMENASQVSLLLQGPTAEITPNTSWCLCRPK